MDADLILKVLNRDRWLCQECGFQARAIHHIVPRSRYGKKGQELRDDERNLISLCEDCHLYKDGGAHRTIKRKEHLELLAKLHGYTYTERRFLEVLNAGNCNVAVC